MKKCEGQIKVFNLGSLNWNVLYSLKFSDIKERQIIVLWLALTTEKKWFKFLQPFARWPCVAYHLRKSPKRLPFAEVSVGLTRGCACHGLRIPRSPNHNSLASAAKHWHWSPIQDGGRSVYTVTLSKPLQLTTETLIFFAGWVQTQFPNTLSSLINEHARLFNSNVLIYN